MSQLNKKILLFIVILLHISVLDLFFVTHNRVVFLWEENSQLLTITTHLAIAIMVTLFYLAISTFRVKYQQRGTKVGERMWWISSLFMLVIIVILI